MAVLTNFLGLMFVFSIADLTESRKIGDILQDTLERLHIKPQDNRSNEELLELYDPEDFLFIFPGMPLTDDPIATINFIRGALNSYQDPPLDKIKGYMTEAYAYKHKGRKMAYAFCINTGTAADGTVLSITRVMQIWRKFGKDWKLHRDYASF